MQATLERNYIDYFKTVIPELKHFDIKVTANKNAISYIKNIALSTDENSLRIINDLEDYLEYLFKHIQITECKPASAKKLIVQGEGIINDLSNFLKVTKKYKLDDNTAAKVVEKSKNAVKLLKKINQILALYLEVDKRNNEITAGEYLTHDQLFGKV